MTTTNDPQTAYQRLVALAGECKTDAEVADFIQTVITTARKVRASKWEGYPWQHPHAHPPGWVSERNGKADPDGACDPRCYELPVAPIPTHGAWLELGGRGTGKTDGASHYINEHMEGPACDARVPGGHRLTIVAPTQADAVGSCVTGVSGLQAINPGISLTTTREGTTVRWPNGAVGRVLGAHSPLDIERLRAWTNVCCVWVEEAAAQRQLGGVMKGVPFTLRLGPNPHKVITTTPRNRPEVVEMIKDPRNVRTKGRTRDADKLHPGVLAELEAMFGGTTLGRQELDAELLADVEGALWVADRPAMVDGEPNHDERPGIENDRVSIADYGWTPHRLPEDLADDSILIPPTTATNLMHRVVIAVDPPGGRTECGVVVVGTIGNHAYPLADLSLAGPPDTWAQVVVDAYYAFGAEGIAAEHTYGGDMVDDVIGTRDSSIPIFKVPTKVGKRLRAEPVQALYQQHRVHHVGVLPGTENEQTTWVPGETKDSPNRIDALVHGVTYLLVRTGPGQVSNPAKSARTIGGGSWRGGSAPGGSTPRRGR